MERQRYAQHQQQLNDNRPTWAALYLYLPSSSSETMSWELSDLHFPDKSLQPERSGECPGGRVTLVSEQGSWVSWLCAGVGFTLSPCWGERLKTRLCAHPSLLDTTERDQRPGWASGMCLGICTSEAEPEFLADGTWPLEALEGVWEACAEGTGDWGQFLGLGSLLLGEKVCNLRGELAEEEWPLVTSWRPTLCRWCFHCSYRNSVLRTQGSRVETMLGQQWSKQRERGVSVPGLLRAFLIVQCIANL